MAVVLLHGWASTFSLTKKYLYPLDSPSPCFWSKGYFSHEEPSETIPAKPYIVIAHSFGLYLASRVLLAKAEKILWYGGFKRPLPHAKKTLEAFRSAPSSVLASFYKRMFFPHPPEKVSNDFSFDRLLCDLELLTLFPYEEFWKRAPFSQKIVEIQGGKDRVISAPPSSSTALFLEEEGHLPHKDSQWNSFLKKSLLSGTSA